jgi:radical SAM protein with 4Fe4S-binding SPASM domain
MRRKYLEFLKRNLNIRLFRYFKKYCLLQCSFLLGKALTGPLAVGINLTDRCNFRCCFCNIKEEGKRELSLHEIKKLLEDLKELSVEHVSFTGGEPFLRKDIFEVLELAKELGFNVNVCTNASLIDESKAKKLNELGIDWITVSLHSLNKEKFERIAGIEGSFKRTIEGVEALAKHCKAKVNVVCVLTSENASDIAGLNALLDFCEKHGILLGVNPHNSFGDRVSYSDKTIEKLQAFFKKNSERLDNSSKFLERALRYMRGEEVKRTCFAGFLSASIDSDGSVYACVAELQFAKPIGNIKKDLFRDIWFSEAYEKKRKELKNCNRCMWNCQEELNILFGACPIR